MASWRHAMGALALVTLASGCTAGPPPAPDAFPATRAPSAFTAQEVATLLTGDGMSSEQREVVERAARTGAVTFDDYRDAVMANIDCLKDAGLSPHDIETDATTGQPLIAYVIGSNAAASEAANDAFIDACARENSDAVEQLYSRNPGAAQLALERQDAHFARSVEACLSQGDYAFSDQEGQTWRDLAGEVIYKRTDNATVACILGTGIADGGMLSLPFPADE